MYRVLSVGILRGLNGLNTSMMNLYRNMDRDLVQWDFLIMNKFRDEESQLETEIRDLGGRIHYLTYDNLGIPKGSRKKFRELLSSDPEIMGVHVHALSLNVWPLWAAGQLDLPVRVIHGHSGPSRSSLASKGPVMNASVRARLRMIEGDDYDRWACSDLVGANLYRGLPFEVFPNAVDTKRFAFNPVYRQVVRSQLDIGEDTVVIGFVGTLYPIKNLLFALQVFKCYHRRNPNSRMLILGGRVVEETEYLDKCMAYPKENGMEDAVRFLGVQPSIDVFYSAFDAMLCPSRHEGFPNVLVEAQAAGVPCLVSDEITETVRLTDLVTMLPLEQPGEDKPEQVWAEKLEQILPENPERRSYGKEIKSAGYDIRDAGRRPTEHYLNRIEAWERRRAKEK